MKYVRCHCINMQGIPVKSTDGLHLLQSAIQVASPHPGAKKVNTYAHILKKLLPD
jgi:hypothetical protein